MYLDISPGKLCLGALGPRIKLKIKSRVVASASNRDQDDKKRKDQSNFTSTIGTDCPAPMDDNMDDAPLKKTVGPIAPVQPFPHARNYALAKVVG
jgi:hypothetical protein